MWWLNNPSKSDDVNEKWYKWLGNPSKTREVNEERIDADMAEYDRREAERQARIDDLSTAIKWWWEVDLTKFKFPYLDPATWPVDLGKFIIPLDTTPPEIFITESNPPKENFFIDTKPSKKIFPIPDKQILPIITDTKPVNELPPEE